MALVVKLVLLITLARLACAFPLGSNATAATYFVPRGPIPTHYPSATSAPDEFALVALNALNKMRTASGLRPLCISAKLQKASQEHSNWMLQTQIFQHSKFGFWENIAVQGEGYSLPGKSCFGQGAQKASDLRASAEFTVNCQLYNSPGHYSNMMKVSHTRAGIAYAIGPYDGFKGFWWTQNFDSGDEPCIAGSSGGSIPVPPPPKQPEPVKPTTQLRQTTSSASVTTTTAKASSSTAQLQQPTSVPAPDQPGYGKKPECPFKSRFTSSISLAPPRTSTDTSIRTTTGTSNTQEPTPTPLIPPITRPECPFKPRRSSTTSVPTGTETVTSTTSAVSDGIETPSPTTAPVDPPVTKPDCPFKKSRTAVPTATETLIGTTSAISGGIETPTAPVEPPVVTKPGCPPPGSGTSSAISGGIETPSPTLPVDPPVTQPECPFKSRTAVPPGTETSSAVSGGIETPAPTAPVDLPPVTKPNCPFKKTHTPTPTGTETSIDQTTTAVSGSSETPAPTPPVLTSPVTKPECTFKKTSAGTATDSIPTSEASGDRKTATPVPTSPAPDQPPCSTRTPLPVVPTEVVDDGSGKKKKSKKTNKCLRRKRLSKVTKTFDAEARPTKTLEVNRGYNRGYF